MSSSRPTEGSFDPMAPLVTTQRTTSVPSDAHFAIVAPPDSSASSGCGVKTSALANRRPAPAGDATSGAAETSCAETPSGGVMALRRSRRTAGPARAWSPRSSACRWQWGPTASSGPWRRGRGRPAPRRCGSPPAGGLGVAAPVGPALRVPREPLRVGGGQALLRHVAMDPWDTAGEVDKELAGHGDVVGRLPHRPVGVRYGDRRVPQWPDHLRELLGNLQQRLP